MIIYNTYTYLQNFEYPWFLLSEFQCWFIKNHGFLENISQDSHPSLGFSIIHVGPVGDIQGENHWDIHRDGEEM